jgi:hypothetical protein
MAAAVSSYPPRLYHQRAYFNPILASFYRAPYIPHNFYQPKPQKPQKRQWQPRTPTPTKITEPIDSNAQKRRPRREPRIRRQVILLPTPEPIYRQVRHRLPTPERKVIQRTIIQKGNGDVIIQQKRHAPEARSQSRSNTNPKARSPRTQQANTDPKNAI